MDYQWYPGHMTRARRMMQEDMKLIDLVIELTDARIPLASRNPDIDSLARQKARILLLNKADLADSSVNKQWISYFREKQILALELNAQRGDGIRNIQPLIEEACREKTERDRKRGILNRPVRAMVAGIPNVGKSTLINALAGRASAKTGNKPGVTRGKQWIRVNKRVELLDTPGILWPKFEDQTVGMKLAMIGTIRDELLDSRELAVRLIEQLRMYYPGRISERYGVDETQQMDLLLAETALKRGCLRREQEPDTERVSALILDDFRKGKLGKISLEFPQSTD